MSILSNPIQTCFTYATKLDCRCTGTVSACLSQLYNHHKRLKLCWMLFSCISPLIKHLPRAPSCLEDRLLVWMATRWDWYTLWRLWAACRGKERLSAYNKSSHLSRLWQQNWQFASTPKRLGQEVDWLADTHDRIKITEPCATTQWLLQAWELTTRPHLVNTSKHHITEKTFGDYVWWL